MYSAISALEIPNRKNHYSKQFEFTKILEKKPEASSKKPVAGSKKQVVRSENEF